LQSSGFDKYWGIFSVSFNTRLAIAIAALVPLFKPNKAMNLIMPIIEVKAGFTLFK